MWAKFQEQQHLYGFLNMALNPKPFVSVEIEKEFKENGKLKKTTRVVTVKGKIFAWDAKEDKGTPQPSEDQRLGIIHSKYLEAESQVNHLIGQIFAQINGLQAEHLITPAKLRSKSFDISAGNIYGEYTIVVERPINQPPEVDESWSLDPADEYDRYVKITRIRSITLETSNEGVEANYKDAMDLIPVSSLTNASFIPSSITISASNAYNKTTVYSVNTEKNSVECTESWLLSNERALVDDTYTIKEGSETVFKSASRQISIKGLEGESGTSKYQNALAKLAQLLPNVEAGSSYGIGGVNGNVRSISVGKNEIAGTANVSIEVSEGIEKSGELLRTVEVNDTGIIDFYASIPAVGKAEGPILQKLGTKKQGTKTVNLTVLYKGGVYKVPEVEEYAPTYGAVFVEKDDISYDERSGRITRNVTWTYGGVFT